MNYYNRNSTSPIMFISGIILGAIFAPKIRQKFMENREKMRQRYERVVDDAADKYAKAKGISKNELGDLVDDLKMHWSRIKDAWNEEQ